MPEPCGLSSHLRAWRGVLIVLGVILGAFFLFVAYFYYRWANPPATSNRAALVDIDSDGDLDAVLANGVNEGVSQITLWINQGGAQRGRAGSYAASSQRLGRGEYQTLAPGDIDGDGDIDLLAGLTWNAIELFTNQGGAQGGQVGQFAGPQSFSPGEYWGGLHPIGLGDLDNDDDLDIFSANCCGGMMWDSENVPRRLPAYNALWIGQKSEGSPAAQFKQLPMPVDEMDGTAALALGDLDGDGDLDAFMARTNEIIGPKEGEYHRRTAYRIWWNDGAGVFRIGDTPLDGPNVRDLALGDLDGDGDLDALAATVSGGQVVLNQGGAQGGGPGDFAIQPPAQGDVSEQFAVQPQMLGSLFANAVFLGDLDGDADLDALLAGYMQAQVWLNDGRGAFHLAPTSLLLPTRSAAALGDVDSDGDLDIFAARLAETYRLWRNDGKGKFTLAKW